MHGDGYETRHVVLFHVFVCIFGLDSAQNTPFFEKITNKIFLLNYAQLLREAKTKSVHCHGQFNIDCDIVLAFKGFTFS